MENLTAADLAYRERAMQTHGTIVSGTILLSTLFMHVDQKGLSIVRLEKEWQCSSLDRKVCPGEPDGNVR